MDAFCFFLVRLYSKENETISQQLLPHKHDIITLLSVGGQWVTTEENLQVRTENGNCGIHVSRPHLDEPVPLYEAKVSMEMVQKNQMRKRQVVQL
ncbi:hypothetical protein lerEdw1_011829 [Lerista edwardsae]|nr:hypothetical protein lerEdw1_011829 [Lerista edwardsae]